MEGPPPPFLAYASKKLAFVWIAAAFARLAPHGPLPSDPRLARRLLRARSRSRNGS